MKPTPASVVVKREKIHHATLTQRWGCTQPTSNKKNKPDEVICVGVVTPAAKKPNKSASSPDSSSSSEHSYIFSDSWKLDVDPPSPPPTKKSSQDSTAQGRRREMKKKNEDKKERGSEKKRTKRSTSVFEFCNECQTPDNRCANDVYGLFLEHRMRIYVSGKDTINPTYQELHDYFVQTYSSLITWDMQNMPREDDESEDRIWHHPGDDDMGASEERLNLSIPRCVWDGCYRNAYQHHKLYGEPKKR